MRMLLSALVLPLLMTSFTKAAAQEQAGNIDNFLSRIQTGTWYDYDAYESYKANPSDCSHFIEFDLNIDSNAIVPNAFVPKFQLHKAKNGQNIIISGNDLPLPGKKIEIKLKSESPISYTTLNGEFRFEFHNEKERTLVRIYNSKSDEMIGNFENTQKGDETDKNISEHANLCVDEIKKNGFTCKFPNFVDGPKTINSRENHSFAQLISILKGNDKKDSRSNEEIKKLINKNNICYLTPDSTYNGILESNKDVNDSKVRSEFLPDDKSSNSRILKETFKTLTR